MREKIHFPGCLCAHTRVIVESLYNHVCNVFSQLLAFVTGLRESVSFWNDGDVDYQIKLELFVTISCCKIGPLIMYVSGRLLLRRSVELMAF